MSCHHCQGIGTLEVTDLFCGAGGSSLGLEHVRCLHCGRQLMQVTQALNHWPLAVEAHNANFPHADHDVHDVEVVPATRFRRTPVLWASTECTHHAYCRGPKDLTDEGRRSRMTNQDVVRFTKHHQYDAVIVENVIEMRLWCDEPSHGDKCSCGRTFELWFQAMLDAGYDGQIVYFNSQFAMVPQSRDRMYVVFWRKGIRRPMLDFRPPSWCSDCESIVRGVQSWKPASRKGLRNEPGKYEWGRYGQQYLYRCPSCAEAVAPAVIGAREIIDWSLDTQLIGERAKPLAPKTRTRIKTGLERLSALDPVTVQVGGHLYERPGYARVWSVRNPLKTVVGTAYMGLVVPGKSDTVAKSTEEPGPTITSRPHQALVVRAGGQNGNGRSDDEPMQTVIGSDRQVAMVVPNMAHNVGGDVAEPIGAVTTGNRHMLVQVNRGTKDGRDDSAHRTQSLDMPHPTVAGHGELALVSMRNHGGVESDDVPAQTVCGSGYHHGVLVYNGTPGHVRDPEFLPAGVVTARDHHSLLVPYYATGVAHPTAEPMGTVTGKDRQALVITDEDIDACGFRMLQWPELLRAQVMHRLPDGADYQLTARRRNKRGQWVELSNELRVKMIGNAVSSPVATMLGHAILGALR